MTTYTNCKNHGRQYRKESRGNGANEMLTLAECVRSGQHGLFVKSDTYHEHADPSAMTRGEMYHVTVRRPGRRSFTYRWAELMQRDLKSEVPWVALWQHAKGRGRSVVLAAADILTIEAAG